MIGPRLARSALPVQPPIACPVSVETRISCVDGAAPHGRVSTAGPRCEGRCGPRDASHRATGGARRGPLLAGPQSLLARTAACVGRLHTATRRNPSTQVRRARISTMGRAFASVLVGLLIVDGQSRARTTEVDFGWLGLGEDALRRGCDRGFRHHRESDDVRRVSRFGVERCRSVCDVPPTRERSGRQRKSRSWWFRPTARSKCRPTDAHLWLSGLKRPLTEKETVTLQLTTDGNLTLSVTAKCGNRRPSLCSGRGPRLRRGRGSLRSPEGGPRSRSDRRPRLRRGWPLRFQRRRRSALTPRSAEAACQMRSIALTSRSAALRHVSERHSRRRPFSIAAVGAAYCPRKCTRSPFAPPRSHTLP